MTMLFREQLKNVMDRPPTTSPPPPPKRVDDDQTEDVPRDQNGHDAHPAAINVYSPSERQSLARKEPRTQLPVRANSNDGSDGSNGVDLCTVALMLLNNFFKRKLSEIAKSEIQAFTMRPFCTPSAVKLDRVVTGFQHNQDKIKAFCKKKTGDGDRRRQHFQQTRGV